MNNEWKWLAENRSIDLKTLDELLAFAFSIFKPFFLVNSIWQCRLFLIDTSNKRKYILRFFLFYTSSPNYALLHRLLSPLSRQLGQRSLLRRRTLRCQRREKARRRRIPPEGFGACSGIRTQRRPESAARPQPDGSNLGGPGFSHVVCCLWRTRSGQLNELVKDESTRLTFSQCQSFKIRWSVFLKYV